MALEFNLLDTEAHVDNIEAIHQNYLVNEHALLLTDKDSFSVRIRQR